MAHEFATVPASGPLTALLSRYRTLQAEGGRSISDEEFGDAAGEIEAAFIDRPANDLAALLAKAELLEEMVQGCRICGAAAPDYIDQLTVSLISDLRSFARERLS